ncbi:MAG: acylphosphatase [Chloroflexi bacterium]|nr:acylphosphatase [Chloroflexota bacterium]
MDATGRPRRVLVMGAAGRDFHNFNLRFRDNPAYRVVAFTAAQIPHIARRTYPPSLAGTLYPTGVPIYPEEEMESLVRDHQVQEVHLAYSDLSHLEVMHKASRVLAAGATFVLLGPNETMLTARIPVVSVCAVRTGAGKSPTSRWAVRWLRDRGYEVAVVRHPMPYGDLERQRVQRFRSLEDLDAAHATVEEREEFEPYLRMGVPVFAGVDYAAILTEVEGSAQVLLWDGGNNDFPFIRPDLHIVLVDPLRAGHELAYHPGEANLRMADVCVVSKVNTASPQQVERVLANIRAVRPQAEVALAELVVSADRPELVRGRRVAIVEDGPTLTHGEMSSGAGTLAASLYGAAEVVDVRPFAVGSIAETYRAYPHLGGELPAMGYTTDQLRDLEATLNAVDADVVLDASPVNLSHLLRINKPIVNVEYELKERGDTLATALERFVQTRLPAPARRPAEPRPGGPSPGGPSGSAQGLRQGEAAQLRALVRGRVQGVSFRDFTQTSARALGLIGWVRNLPDGGTVEVLAQGPRVALEQLLAHLRQGPPGAFVAQVDVEWGAPEGQYRRFEIRG